MGPPPGREIDGRLSGAAGVEIFWRRWPAEAPRCVVVIAHGAGEHSGRYDHVGRRLAGAGFDVYALDHRGHGRSGGPRALVERMENVVADLDQVVVMAATEHPGRPVFLLGHSMGGTVAVCYCLRHQDRLAGLILSSPLAELAAAPAPVRALAQLLGRVAPRLGLFPVDASQVSRDPDVVSAYRQDPLVYHGRLPARTIVELAAAVATFPELAPRITLPTLIVYAGADGLAPTSGSVMLGQRLGGGDVTVIPYEGLYHEVFNEPEQDQVLDDVVAWLDTHLAAPLR